MCLNGAEVRDRYGKILVSSPLSEEELEAVLQTQKQTGAFLVFHTGGVPFTYMDNTELDDYADRFFEHHKGRDIPFTRRFTEYVRNYIDFLKERDRERERRCGEAEFLFTSEENAPAIYAGLRDRDLDLAAGKHFTDIEVTVKGVNKGNALLAYCRKLGISKEEVIVFGDSENDLSMFRVFPHSYAMANSEEETKRKAAHVALSNEEDGVAAVIETVLDQQ